MNELIKVNYESEQPTVLGKDLYECLGVSSNYTTWFNRMCEYGFSEGVDFIPFLEESTGGRRSQDYQLTVAMAKEIAMIQRTKKGKEVRTYFIELENKWNDPDVVMARALKLADKKIFRLTETVDVLQKENDMLSEKALEWAGRKFINAAVRSYAGNACAGSFGEAWLIFKKELLYKYSINLNSRITAYLNNTGKKTKPKTLDMLNDDEIPSAVATVVALCKEKNVDISDLIKNLSKDSADAE